jgi:hypothetical protein
MKKHEGNKKGGEKGGKMINFISFNIILISFSHFQSEDLIKI